MEGKQINFSKQIIKNTREKFKLFKEAYGTLLKYYTNVKRSVDSAATTPDAIATALVNDFSGAQKKYMGDLDYLSKLFILVTKFVNPVPTTEIVKAIQEMKINVEKEGGRKRILKRSNRKTKKLRKTVKRVRKTKRKGKK